MTDMVTKGLRVHLNRIANAFLSPPEHVLQFVRVPERPSWTPVEAKVDYLYWLRVLPFMTDGFGIPIRKVLEIGANFGQDAWFLMQELGLDPRDVVAVEPLPECLEVMRLNAPFHVLPYAVTEANGTVEFWVPSAGIEACGMASLGKRVVGDSHAFEAISVTARTGIQILKEIEWTGIDLLKIDVEGYAAQVLRSFGDALMQVKTVQVETERCAMWQDQETESCVFEILKAHEFVMIDYQLATDGIQADSMWVGRKHLPTKFFNRVTQEWERI
jgi:FkbM family methyltransferase